MEILHADVVLEGVFEHITQLRRLSIHNFSAYANSFENLRELTSLSVLQSVNFKEGKCSFL